MCAATSGLSAADQGVVIACTMRGQVFAWPLVAPDRFRDRLERAISVSPDGLLYAGQVSGRVEVRDLATGRTLRLLPQPVNCRATALSRDSGHVYIGADDGVLRAFDLLRGEYTWSVQAHDGPICSIDVALDGAVVASAAEDGTTRAWDARTGALLGSCIIRRVRDSGHLRPWRRFKEPRSGRWRVLAAKAENDHWRGRWRGDLRLGCSQR